jgi:uncharacterized protein
MVIENHPRLEDGSPFPTLFWLTCPILAKRVSTIESSGAMQAMTKRLHEDSSLRSRFAEAVDRLRTRRDQHQVIEESGGPPGGGPDRVKCLHAHVAHHLVDPPNPIGALTLVSTGWPDCRQPCFSTEDEQG